MICHAMLRYREERASATSFLVTCHVSATYEYCACLMLVPPLRLVGTGLLGRD